MLISGKGLRVDLFKIREILIQLCLVGLKAGIVYTAALHVFAKQIPEDSMVNVVRGSNR